LLLYRPYFIAVGKQKMRKNKWKRNVAISIPLVHSRYHS
jgi:hypothetical protein